MQLSIYFKEKRISTYYPRVAIIEFSLAAEQPVDPRLLLKTILHRSSLI